MSTFATRAHGSSAPADDVLGEILREIAVPVNVLKEAKDRRNLVLQIAMKHEAARAWFYSGSIAHGTENSPLGDADCGLKVNRRFEAFRIFGPDAPEGRGPEEFVVMFADFILPRLRATYPQAGGESRRQPGDQVRVQRARRIGRLGSRRSVRRAHRWARTTRRCGNLDPKPMRGGLGPGRPRVPHVPDDRERPKESAGPSRSLGPPRQASGETGRR